MKYVVLVTRLDGSRACYGPMTIEQAKAFVATIPAEKYNPNGIEIIYLTQG